MVSEFLCIIIDLIKNICLNPCFTGRWYRSIPAGISYQLATKEVLILVLLEDGIGALSDVNKIVSEEVLILVLLEDGIGAVARSPSGSPMRS